MSYQEKARKILKEKGYKKTKSRIAIIHILSQQTKAVSFVDIVRSSQEYPLDEVTVYRFLQELESLHLVKKITSVRGYMKCDGDTHTHNHYFLVCNDCHDIQEKVLHDNETIIKALGVYPDKQCIEIVGKCEKCHKN